MTQRTPTDDEATILASEFIKHGDMTKAFNAAFPDSKSKTDARHTVASKIFAMPKIRLRIDQLKVISKKNSEEEFTMTVSTLKKVLAGVIQKGAKDKPDGTPINLAAVVSAVKELNSMDGNHSPLKTQEIKANDLTPWDDISTGVDKNDKEE